MEIGLKTGRSKEVGGESKSYKSIFGGCFILFSLSLSVCLFVVGGARQAACCDVDPAFHFFPILCARFIPLPYSPLLFSSLYKILFHLTHKHMPHYPISLLSQLLHRPRRLIQNRVQDI